MKPELLSTELLGELSAFKPDTYFSPFTKAKFLRECKKALKTDPATAYMCMGVVYGYSDDFNLMNENFQTAMRLSPGDLLILSNYISSLANFGRYLDAISLTSKNQEVLGSEFCVHAFFKALGATFDLKSLDELEPTYTQKAKMALSVLGISESEVGEFMSLFNSLMETKNVRFGVQFKSSWDLDGDVAYLYYDFMGTPEQSMSILDEFDSLVRKSGKSEIASKVCIILLPIKPSLAA